MRLSQLSSALAAATALSALAACSPSSGTADAGTSIDDLACSSDAECASQKLVCDKLRRTCVCTSDAMCAGSSGGPYCNAFTGKCVKDIAGCKSDASCPANEFCDVALRTCRAKKAYCEACTEDAECGGPDDNCVHHPDFQQAPPFCATACGAGDTCPPDQKCSVTEKGKQCIPAVGQCNAVPHCIPDSGQNCRADADCTEGTSQVCDHGLGKCVTSQTTCAQGQACDPLTKQCVAACRMDAECQQRFSDPNYQCVNNTCIRADACHSDADCPTTKWCFKEGGAEQGICAPACQSDNDCPLGQRCVGTADGHHDCSAGCSADSDCPLNSVCNNGQCAMSGPGGVEYCQVKDVCNFRESCINNVCVAQPQHCQNASNGCGAGTPAYLFTPYSCSSSSVSCPAGIAKVHLSDSSCPNSTAFACQITRCLYSCVSDAQCPKGFYCADSVNVNGQQMQLCNPVDPSLCQ